ncbi:hypothetical protein KP509_07G020100 [Ceratopteris richardii]|uniref:Uncharacterized protein n=1 Tax=Ceratopteris richardii TaxID=49495 RepID=A0A8T2UFV5_CERRI|nr:hypothetical protein KP509_07G020100 [Ceratopteris richardii]
MHPAIRHGACGRAGTPVDYTLHEHVLPDPPHHAKEAHDSVIDSLTPDLTGKRKAKWDKSTELESAPKFSRDVGHYKLHNVCTVPRLCYRPELRQFQCWRLCLDSKPTHRYFETLRRKTNIRKSRIFAKADGWGLWNFSTELVSKKERENQLTMSIKHDQTNKMCYYKKHENSIKRVRNMYKEGISPFEKFEIPNVTEKTSRVLKPRRQDVADVKNLRED